MRVALLGPQGEKGEKGETAKKVTRAQKVCRSQQATVDENGNLLIIGLSGDPGNTYRCGRGHWSTRTGVGLTVLPMMSPPHLVPIMPFQTILRTNACDQSRR